MSAPENPLPPAPSSATGGVASGQTVGGGRFLLKRILGQGGMGLVWLAHDLRLQEPVALKFLPPQLAFDPGALEDLRRETLRSRKLSHPNIVRIHELHHLKDEPSFISMEYVDGLNLHQVRENRPLKVLNWKFLRPLVRQLCAALGYAHGEKIVHRDLKPANLLLDSSGRLKLSDFGLARVTHDSLTRLAGATMPGGTINFMSPQQADGKPADPSDDIYALGATLYDLLTSRPPFYLGDVPYQVRHTRPDPMPQRLADLELANDIPSEVSALVMSCLAKEPEQRPASAQAVLDFLEAAEKQPPALLVTTAPANLLATVPPPIAPSPASPAPPVPPQQISPPVLPQVPPQPALEPADEAEPPGQESRWLSVATLFAAFAGLIIVAGALVLGMSFGRKWLAGKGLAPLATGDAPTPVAPTTPARTEPVPPAGQPAERALPGRPTESLLSGHWETCPSLPGGRVFHSAVWTGKEMIIWGGGSRGQFLHDGAAFNPTTRKWRVISSQNAPSGRWAHAAVWTGREMLVWGGRSSFPAAQHKNDGAAYNPVTDTWRPLKKADLVGPRSQMVALWTGAEMIVWGGWADGKAVLSDGARYDPNTDAWTRMASAGSPAGRFDAEAIWTGTELVLWGGRNSDAVMGFVPGGGSYDAKSDRWRPISDAGAPSPRVWPGVVWAGREMLLVGGGAVAGGANKWQPCADGFRYDPAEDRWTPIADPPPAAQRLSPKAVWTGQEMLLWGGAGFADALLNTGLAFTPGTGRWVPLQQNGAPPGLRMHSAVWTGNGMLVFGDARGGYGSENTLHYYTAGQEAVPTSAELTPAPEPGASVMPGNASIYRACDGFRRTSNPADVWSFGWVPEIGGPFTLLQTRKHVATDNGVNALTWQLGLDQDPAICCNTNREAAVAVFGTGRFPTDTVWLSTAREGRAENFTVIRFTTPSGGGGRYQVRCSLRPWCSTPSPHATDSTLCVAQNGRQLYVKSLPAAQSHSYSATANLKPGETLDFALGRGPSGRQTVRILDASLTRLP